VSDGRSNQVWTARGPHVLARADRATLNRINRLIDNALRDLSTCIGKPEPLRHMLAGAWSRRISDEHRPVYLVVGDGILVLQARFHHP
jgi:toxin YoeB